MDSHHIKNWLDKSILIPKLVRNCKNLISTVTIVRTYYIIDALKRSEFSIPPIIGSKVTYYYIAFLISNEVEKNARSFVTGPLHRSAPALLFYAFDYTLKKW